LLRRRRQIASEPGFEPTPAPETTESDERAEELRAKLAENRVEDEPEPEPEPESPEDRRRRVHEEGRAALDDMKSDGAET
jgi:hypothetical protein